MDKKLVKSVNNKKLCGVCAGVADYLNLDPTIVRVIWAVAVVCFGIGLILYIIMALVLPDGQTKN